MIVQFLREIDEVLKSMLMETPFENLKLTRVEMNIKNELAIYGKDIIDLYNVREQEIILWQSDDVIEASTLLSNFKSTIKDYIDNYKKYHLITEPNGDITLNYLLVSGESSTYSVELVKLYDFKSDTFNQIIDRYSRDVVSANLLTLKSTFQFRLDYTSYKVLTMMIHGIKRAKVSGQIMENLDTGEQIKLDPSQKEEVEKAIRNKEMVEMIIDFKLSSGIDYTVTPITNNIELYEIREPKLLNDLDLNSKGITLFLNSLDLHTPLYSVFNSIDKITKVMFQSNPNNISFLNTNPNIVKGGITTPESITNAKEQLLYKNNTMLNQSRNYDIFVLNYKVGDKSLDKSFLQQLSSIGSIIVITNHPTFESFCLDLGSIDGLKINHIIDTDMMHIVRYNSLVKMDGLLIDRILHNEYNIDLSALSIGVNYHNTIHLSNNKIKILTEENTILTLNNKPYTESSIIEFVNNTLDKREVELLLNNNEYVKVIDDFLISYKIIKGKYFLSLTKMKPNITLIQDVLDNNYYIEVPNEVSLYYTLNNITSILDLKNKTYCIIKYKSDIKDYPINKFDYIIDLTGEIAYNSYQGNLIIVTVKPIKHYILSNKVPYIECYEDLYYMEIKNNTTQLLKNITTKEGLLKDINIKRMVI